VAHGLASSHVLVGVDLQIKKQSNTINKLFYGFTYVLIVFSWVCIVLLIFQCFLVLTPTPAKTIKAQPCIAYLYGLMVLPVLDLFLLFYGLWYAVFWGGLV
jgi:hypothetical protein